VVWCDFKSWHHHVGLHVHNMLINLGSIVNICRGNLYDHLMSMTKFILIMTKVILWAPNLWGKQLQAQVGFAIHLALIPWFTSYKKWMRRDKYPYEACLPYTSWNMQKWPRQNHCSSICLILCGIQISVSCSLKRSSWLVKQQQVLPNGTLFDCHLMMLRASVVALGKAHCQPKPIFWLT